jgi:MFS family permease
MTHATTHNPPRWVRFWSWAGPLFGIAWIAAPTINFFVNDPSAWQIALVVPLIPAFAGLFLYEPGRRRAPDTIMHPAVCDRTCDWRH